jgi:hypothetical protein
MLTAELICIIARLCTRPKYLQNTEMLRSQIQDAKATPRQQAPYPHARFKQSPHFPAIFLSGLKIPRDRITVHVDP